MVDVRRPARRLFYLLLSVIAAAGISQVSVPVQAASGPAMTTVNDVIYGGRWNDGVRNTAHFLAGVHDCGQQASGSGHQERQVGCGRYVHGGPGPEPGGDAGGNVVHDRVSAG